MSTDRSCTKPHLLCAKNRGVSTGRQFSERSLVTLPAASCESAGRDEKHYRVRWQGRRALQHLFVRPIVRPDECQPIAIAVEVLREFRVPERAQRSRARHHEHIPCFRKQLQDIVDNSGVIDRNRHGGLVLAEGSVSQEACLDRRKENRGLREKLVSMV